MDWIAIINAVIPYAANGTRQKIQLTGTEQAFEEAGLDSLDVAVIGVYLCELLDIPVALHKDVPLAVIADLTAFLDQHAVQRGLTPAAIFKALS